MKALLNKIQALIQSGRLEFAIDELDKMNGHMDSIDILMEQLLEEGEDDDKDEKDVKGKPDDKGKPYT